MTDVKTAQRPPKGRSRSCATSKVAMADTVTRKDSRNCTLLSPIRAESHL